MTVPRARLAAEKQRCYELVCIFRKALPKSADDPVLSGHVPDGASDCGLFPQTILRSGKLISFVRALSFWQLCFWWGAPRLLEVMYWGSEPFCSLFGCRSLVTVTRRSPPQWALGGTFTSYISTVLLESIHLGGLEDFALWWRYPMLAKDSPCPCGVVSAGSFFSSQLG